MYPYKIFHRNTQRSYTMAVSYMPSSPFEFISLVIQQPYSYKHLTFLAILIYNSSGLCTVVFVKVTFLLSGGGGLFQDHTRFLQPQTGH